MIFELFFNFTLQIYILGACYTCDLRLLRVENGPDFLCANPSSSDRPSNYEVATFGLGCFWGGELAFMREPGVVGTKVGYSQGELEAP